MLTCAVAGGVITGNPNQPATRDDVIREAVGAAKAGATIVHIHARTVDGEMTQAPEDYNTIKDEVREQVDDVVLNFTTGGKLGSLPEERRRSLQAQPELASLNCGSINFGPDDVVFTNPRSLIADVFAEMGERGIIPEYECFDMGMAVSAAALATSTDEPLGMMHMVLGVIGGAPASVDAIEMFQGLVPDNVPWMVTAVGRHNFPMMAVTLALGGHIRTGLEDVVYVGPGEYAESNAQLVTRAIQLCDAIGRPVATPAQAREILGIK
jgi:3-keto-5-aminohexanoate cleavage enzyme